MRARRTKIWAAVAATAMVATAVPIGAANPVAAATADLFFSEYIEGSSNNKALEIYNGTGASVDLAGYSVERYSNGSTTAVVIPLSGTVADGDVAVIANPSSVAAVLAVSDLTNGNINFNGNDAVALVGPSGVADVIGQIGNDPGAEWGTGDVSTQNNTIRRLASVCAGDTDGSDAFDPAVEWAGFAQDTFDGLGAHIADCGDDPTGPTPGDLVITEVMQNPAAVADGAGEWFEITNVSGGDIDIDGWTISDNDNDSHLIANGGPLVVAAGDAIVLGNNVDVLVNGGADVDYSYGLSWFLSNGADEVVLTDPNATVFDRIEYDGGTAWPDPNGASMSLDPASTNVVDNDDGASWCESTTTFGAGDAGTPGATNDSCGPVVLPCTNITPIADVQGAVDVTPFDGLEVTVRGIVTADDGGEIVIQEAAGGARSGIVVFSSDNAASIGDEVCVTGLASERFGMTQIGGNGNPGAVIDVLSTGNALPAPALLPTGSVAAEDFESVLVRVEAVTVDNADLGNGEYSVDDGTGTVRVDDLYFGFAPGAGQSLDFVQGPLRYSFDNFKIEPRDADDIGVPIVVEVCGDPATFIHDIQGNGASSPILGQTVSIEGVVVGDFQDDVGANGDLNGFFVQEEDADADSDPLTSEGIFVFQGSDPDLDLAIGDAVRVTGTVEEFNSSTQLGNVVSVLVCDEGVALPAPTVVTLPFESLDDLEAFEHMYVTFPQSLTISEFFNFDRFGEMVLTTDRLFQPTAVFEPGSVEAAELGDLNDRSKITLDDGRTSQNPDPAIHPNGEEFTLDNRFRGGDLVTNATGVLNYAFGLYRIQPTQGADYEAVNPRTDPEPVGGNVTVASFNVLNYFNTLDGNGPICGPLQDQGCRGADDENERLRQLTKIVAAIDTMDADVIGIIEVENTVGVEAMADIVDGLNAIGGAGTYDYIDTGLVGNDVIKVGFIYQPGNVTPVGDYAVLDDPAFVAPFPGDDKNRAALAQTFQVNETGGVFTAAVNHLKSKGSGCGPGDDDPEAGSCNLTRTVAAQVLADWLADDPTGSGDPDVLIIGDLNSYDKEDPIDALKTAGYADLLDIYQGEFAYSFVFSGEWGYLDYAMANASLAAQVTGSTAWHSNSDEPDILDYDTSFKKDAQDALYEPNAFRASDHDAVIVGLDVCESEAPELEVMLSRSVLSPPNHKYRDVEATVTVTDNFDPDPTVRLVSVTSSESDNGEGDGNTVNDIVVLDDDSFLLRAERSGSGNGRTYTITYEAEDDCGNISTAIATVFVPLNNGGGKPS